MATLRAGADHLLRLKPQSVFAEWLVPSCLLHSRKAFVWLKMHRLTLKLFSNFYMWPPDFLIKLPECWNECRVNWERKKRPRTLWMGKVDSGKKACVEIGRRRRKKVFAWQLCRWPKEPNVDLWRDRKRPKRGGRRDVCFNQGWQGCQKDLLKGNSKWIKGVRSGSRVFLAPLIASLYAWEWQENNASVDLLGWKGENQKTCEGERECRNIEWGKKDICRGVFLLTW